MKDSGMLLQGIEKSMVQNYRAAERIYKEFIAKYPEHEPGYYLLAILYATEMMDFEAYHREEEFFRTLNTYRAIVERKRDNPNRTAWDLYFEAGIKIVESAFLMRRGNIRAALLGHQSLSIINAAYAMDPKHYDIHFLKGLAYYARSEIAETFGWLGFSGVNNRSFAITKLTNAKRWSLISRDVSVQTLVEIYTKEEMFAEAEKLALDFYRKNPQNRPILWALAKLYYNWGKYEASLVYYKKILSFFETIRHQFPYNYLSVSYTIGVIYFNMENHDRALHYYQKAVDGRALIPSNELRRMRQYPDKAQREINRINRRR